MANRGAASDLPPIVNFGGNVQFQPKLVAAPRTEAELLSLMAGWKGRKIRAIGRLHSWSEAAATDEVLVDLRYFDQVSVEITAEGPRATVGGGCQIKRVLTELDRQAGMTLPTLGLISEQAIAGAVATGTHGSGRHCMSHYVTEVRLATYDPQTGEPVIRSISEGDELRAAQCSVGCLGVVVSVKIVCRPKYNIEEFSRVYSTLEEVLDAERDYPLQQFYLIPWLWRFVGQHRRESDAKRSLLAWLYRLYWFVTIDIALHLMLKLMVQILRSVRGVKFFYRRMLMLFVIRNWHVVDRSSRMLIMEHELFRHIEIEVFVRRSKLKAAVGFAQEALECFAGNVAAVSEATRQQLESIGKWDELRDAAGSYTHHYAICVRRVLADGTLISMSSGGDESYYALSFISYARPGERAGFIRFAEFLATAMANLFDARPHWGKVCPLDAKQLEQLYPRMAEFRQVANRLDPEGVFRNSWAESKLFSASYS